MDKIPFEDGTLVKAGYVEIDGTKHETVQPEYTGKTPLSAYNLIKMQDNVENAINDGDLVRKIKISGARKQETREGYNKANYNDSRNDSNSNFDIGDVKSGKSYTLVLDIIGTISYNLRYSTSQNIVKTEYSRTGQVIINFDATETDKLIFNGFSGVEYTGMKIMLLEGTFTSENIPEYEQYGASPSIEFESPIESVGDNINLCDNQFRQGSYNLLNNKIRLFTTQNYKVEAGKTYTLATNLDFKTYKYSIGLAVSEFPEVAQSDLYYDSGWLEKAETTFTSEQDGYFGIGITRQNASEIVPEDMKDFYFKLVEGTSTGAYSPYGQGSIEIKQCGKNYSNFLHYADGKAEGVTNYGITYKIVNEYSSIISGKPSVTEFRVGNVWNSTKIVSELLKKKQYIFENNLSLNMQVTIVNSANNTYRQVSIKNKEVITLLDGEDGISSLRINIDTNTTYDNTLLEYDIYDVEQYKTKALYTQQPFRSVKDVEDTFAKKMGKWHEEHPIFRKIFDGTENWLYQDRGNGIYRFNILLDNAINLSGRNRVLSNYFLYKGSSEEDGNCFTSEKYVYFYSSISSMNDFKSKLTELYNAGTPLYVDYVLATPTLIECTAEQVEVLNDIYSAYGEGMANIICNDKIEPVIEIVKETKETVQSENDKAISALLARVTELETIVATLQTATAEEGA